MSSHSAVALMSGMSEETLQALRTGKLLADSKLEVLRSFVRTIIESRGWPTEGQVQAFLAAGYTRRHIFEVILGIAMKTMSNYSSHITGVPVDAAFEPTRWKKAGAAV